MIVVDTNVLIYYFVNSNKSPTAVDLFARDPVWVAPFLWRSEFRSTVLLYLRKELLSFPQVLQIVQAAESLMVDREFYLPATEILQLAQNSSCSAYDCEYVALAKEMGVALVTEDRQILREFPETAVSMAGFLANGS